MAIIQLCPTQVGYYTKERKQLVRQLSNETADADVDDICWMNPSVSIVSYRMRTEGTLNLANRADTDSANRLHFQTALPRRSV